jgi:VanZ family protein
LTFFAQYWLPPLVWMVLIWGFSSDLGSAENTSGVFAWIVTALFPWATPAQIALAHALVRKLGHLTEYAVLAALWFRAFHTGHRLQSAPGALAALALSVAWAIADELHQGLVPSRRGSPFDVMLDTTGAALALLALHARTAITRSLARASASGGSD